MRILIVHEAPAGAGGVESYLASLMPALAGRGHEVAFLCYNARSEEGPTRLLDSRFLSASAADEGLDGAVAKMRDWGPDVCFSHNMRPLDVDERLARQWPVVKMLHGYFGTCVSGQKAHAFPGIVPCGREFGPPCLALYLPRRCGQLRPVRMFAQYAWASRQRTLFDAYSHVVVASGHMATEYRRHGIGTDRVTVAPLFPTAGDGAKPMRPLPESPTVLFMARMTAIKGGALLVHAIAEAIRISGIPIRLVLAGQGPEQARLQNLSDALRIDASFPGWLTGEARVDALRAATLVAIPSLWPEPFGLVGLEAAAHGVPAVALDVGGIREWLRDGESGRLIGKRDARSLGRAIADLCASPGEVARLGDGAQRVARTFSIDAHIAILERDFARAAGARTAIA
jgi:glycosyltransferase involved in cell wall biosynthesis